MNPGSESSLNSTVYSLGETTIVFLLRLCAWVAILLMATIVCVLAFEAFTFFAEVSVFQFFSAAKWNPLIQPQSFGVWPLICGTILVAAGASLVGMPLGLGVAIFLAEYASPRLRAWLKPMIEILAGIPSVVFGFVALLFVTPILRAVWPGVQVFNAFSAALVVGLMILPMVASVSDDALRSVSEAMKLGGYALGATKAEVISQISIPAARSGILASFFLAVSRAIGETMAVTLAAGSTPKFTLSYFESIQTMTSYMVQVSLGDTPHGSVEYQSLFAVGLVLFFMTLSLNILSRKLIRRKTMVV